MKLCGFDVGLDQPFFLIAGPCVIESEALALETVGRCEAEAQELQQFAALVKTSYDLYGQAVKAAKLGPQ